MDPNDITLNNLSKSFEYFQISSAIDSTDDIDELRNIAKSYCKLFYAQQEAIENLGVSGL
jgi:hypothetical protein